MSDEPALHRPDRRHLDRPARGARAQAQAPAGARPADRRLPAAADRLGQARATTACRRSPRSPPASRRWPRSWRCRSSRCRSSRARSRTARTSGRSSPTCANSGSIEQDADVVMFVFREEYYVERLKPREGTAEFQEWKAEDDGGVAARPRSSSASSAMARSARWSCRSRATSRASAIWPATTRSPATARLSGQFPPRHGACSHGRGLVPRRRCTPSRSAGGSGWMLGVRAP